MRRITIRRVRSSVGRRVSSFEMGESREGAGWPRTVTALLATLVLLQAGGAGAAIYRCTENGRISYRDKPCAASEKQTRMGQGVLAGCHEIEDVSEWTGGSGTWIIRIAADGEDYQLREHFPAADPAARQADPQSVALRRATLDELDAVGLQFRLKATSGYVLDMPDAGAGTMGLFNTWDHSGTVQLVGLFSFANGPARRVACP